MRDDGDAPLNIAKKLGAAVLPLTSQVANDAANQVIDRLEIRRSARREGLRAVRW
jgi:hypothetical protein